MEDKKDYSCLSWIGEGEEDDEDEEEWSTSHQSAAKRQSNGFSNSPAKKLKMDSFCTSLESDSISARPQPSSDVLTSRSNHKRTIVHIDIDCFYAQVEMILNPSLQTKPLGIQQKYIIVTCNYVARERGLTKLMRLSDARKKCPDLVIINGENLSRYRNFSKRVNELLLRITPNVERLGFDENFLDVTDLVEAHIKESIEPSSLHPDGIVYAEREIATEKVCACGCHQRLTIGSQIAAEIRKKIFDEIGLTCCAGIAHNKLLAKLAGECNKPNKQTLLFPELANRLLRSLPARKIPGIGSSSSKRLQSIGISSVLELQTCPLASLQSEFGDGLALILKQLSHGIDDAEVIASGAPKSMSEEDTYHQCTSLKEVTKNLRILANNLLLRLTDDVGHPQTIRLTIRRDNGELVGDKKESRQGPIPSHFSSSKSTNDQKLSVLLSMVSELFKKLVNIKQPFNIRLLNICLTNFQKLSNCGKRAFSSFFKSSIQSETTTINNFTDKFSQMNELKCENDDKDEVADGTASNKQFGIIFPQNENGRPFISSNSGNTNGAPESLELQVKGRENMAQQFNLCSEDPIVSENHVQNHRVAVKSTVNSACSNSKEIPSNVDLSVFNSLPEDVQRELIEQWKQEQKSSVTTKTQKRPKGLLKYFSKPL